SCPGDARPRADAPADARLPRSLAWKLTRREASSASTSSSTAEYQGHELGGQHGRIGPMSPPCFFEGPPGTVSFAPSGRGTRFFYLAWMFFRRVFLKPRHFRVPETQQGPERIRCNGLNFDGGACEP